MRITFSGASDDLVELDGDVREEYPCINGLGTDRDGARFAFGGLRITVENGPGGVWTVAVGQMDEDAEVTARVVSLEPGNGENGAAAYSMALTVEAPDGTVVVREHVG